MNTISPMPVRRNLSFDLPAERITDWHPGGTHLTLSLNTLSVFFPVGERFFIDSVRHYRDEVKDPALREAVRAFIAQEAFHGREHDDYNGHMQAAGLDTDRLEGQVKALLDRVQRYLPKSMQLAATIALEHMTALMADSVLTDPALLEEAEVHYADLWRWHAVEETEHKAVVYDVYREVMGNTFKSWAVRSFALIVATGIFFALYYRFLIQITGRAEGAKERGGWRRTLGFQWGRPGFFRRLVPQWLDFLRPGFHPWDHDNREFLAEAERLSGLYGKPDPASPLRQATA